jgi:hypothetical protein
MEPMQITPLRFLAGLLIFCQLVCNAPYPAYALRPTIEERIEAGLEEDLRENSGRSETWRDFHAWITTAIQNHPGGRTTMQELADQAGVSIATLSAHDYRSLIDKENKRRGSLQRPRILIGNRGRPRAGGLEEQHRTLELLATGV